MLKESGVIEINTLFGEFMGYNVIPYQHNEYRPIYNGNKFTKTVGEEKKLWNELDVQFTGRFTECVKYPFNTEFNYLIPIIRRIEELGYVVAIAGISYKVYRLMDEQNPISSFVCGDLSRKTDVTCSLLVEFIKWYNLHG